MDIKSSKEDLSTVHSGEESKPEYTELPTKTSSPPVIRKVASKDDTTAPVLSPSSSSSEPSAPAKELRDNASSFSSGDESTTSETKSEMERGRSSSKAKSLEQTTSIEKPELKVEGISGCYLSFEITVKLKQRKRVFLQ